MRRGHLQPDRDKVPNLCHRSVFIGPGVINAPLTGLIGRSYHRAAMNTKSLGAILKDWRIEKNLSQGQLGKSAGLSRRIIGNIERGERKLDNQHLVRLCRALGRSVEELVLSWSRSSLEELQQIERALHGSLEPALARTASGSIDEIIDGIADHLKELYQRAQEDLIQKLRLQMGMPGSSSLLPPTGIQRTRSRVSRKGRVGAMSS